MKQTGTKRRGRSVASQAPSRKKQKRKGPQQDPQQNVLGQIPFDVWDYGIRPFLTAEETQSVLQAFPVVFEGHVERAMKGCSEDQARVIRTVVLGLQHNLLVLGGPGTGKTHVLKKIKELLDLSGQAYCGMAPTGCAAVNAGIDTIHRTFPKLNKIDGEWDQRQGPPKGFRAKGWDERKIAILDEVSMVSKTRMEELRLFMAGRRRGFGHAVVVAFGDFRQLPPHDGKNRLSQRCFHSRLLHTFRVEELRQVFRQKSDSALLPILQQVGTGGFTLEIRDFLYQRRQAYRRLTEAEKLGIVHLYWRTDDQNKHNRECARFFEDEPAEYFDTVVTNIVCQVVTQPPIRPAPNALAEEKRETFYLNTTSGRFECMPPKFGLDLSLDEATEELRDLAEIANTAQWFQKKEKEKIDSREIKKGYVVQVARNVYETDEETGIRTLRWANGEIGKVVDVHPGRGVVIEKPDGTKKLLQYKPYRVSVQNTTWDGPAHTTYYAWVRYLPVDKAFAITINKAQGMTLDAAAMDLSIVGPHYAYVALSRVRTVEGIYVTRYDTGKICKTDPKVRVFYKFLQHRGGATAPQVNWATFPIKCS